MNASRKPRPTLSYTRAVAAALVAAGLLPTASAQEVFTWSGAAGSGNWSDAANWSPGTPNGGGDDSLVFGGLINLSTSNDLAGWAGTKITFGPSSGAFTVGGGVVNLGAFGGLAPEIRNDSTQVQTFNAPVAFDGTAGSGQAVLRAAGGNLAFAGGVGLTGTTTLVIQGGGGRTVTISSPLTGGTNGIRIIEDNVLVLNGANTYTGATVIEAGELQMAGGSLSAASAITVGASATPGTSAAFRLTSPTGGTTISNPITIQPGNGSNRVIGGSNTSGPSNYTGAITLAAGGDATVTLTAESGGTVNVLGGISGAGGVRKIGVGLVQLFANNGYTGATVIQGGSLRIAAAELIPNTSALTIDGGSFEMQGNSDTVASTTLISGSISGTGVLTSTGYTFRSGTVSVPLAGTGGLLKESTGTVSLGGISSFTGGVQILGGMLTIPFDVALGNAANAITIDGGRLNVAGSFTNTRPITLGASAANALSAETGFTYVVNSTLTGLGGFTKLGPGTITIGGTTASAYAGTTTVSDGILFAGKTAGVNSIPGDLFIDLTGSFRLQTANQIADTASITMNGGTFNNPAETAPANNGPIDTVTNLTIHGGAFASNRNPTPFTITGLLTISGGSALASRGGSIAAPKLVMSGGAVNLDGGSTTATQESRLDIGAGGIEASGGVINFNSGPSAQTATSTGGLLRLGGNVVVTGPVAFSRTVNATPRAVLDLQGANRIFQIDSSLTIGGITAADSINVANGGITKTGPGTLLLSGYDAATAYNGGLLIQQGKVQFATAPALGGISNTITIDGTTLENTAGGDVIVSDATAGRVFNVTAAGATFTSTQTLGATSFERAGSLTGSGPITKDGPGIVRVRADNAGLSSQWTVNAGVLEVSTSSALGTGSVIVNATATLAGRSSATVDTPFNMPITLAGGTLGTRTGDFTNFTGTVAVTAPSVIALRSYSTPANAQSITISGLVSGNADLTLVGSTTPVAGKALLLTNPANTFAGTYHVNSLQTLSNAPAGGVGKTLGTGTVELSNALLILRDDGTGNGGTLAYGNNVNLLGAGSPQIDVNRASVAGSSTGNTFQLGSLALGGQTLFVTGGNGYKLEFSGNTSLAADAAISTLSADLVLSGPVSGGFGFTKLGAGKMTLGSANTYTGPTNVLAGILEFKNVSANGAGNGSITVSRGAAVAAGFALDQTFLSRINGESDGIIALSTNSPGGLDFSATGANLPFIRLGAINRSELSGSLTMAGNSYRLGGGGGTLVISGANTLSGTATLDVDAAGTTAGNVALTAVQNFSGNTTIRGASLILGGAGGALTATGSVGVERNGTLLLDNDGTASGATGVNGNRISNTTPITISRGTVELRQENSAIGASNIEIIGPVSYSQNAALRVGALGGDAVGELRAQSLTRTGRGTLTLFGAFPGSLGAADRIASVSAPALTNGMAAPHIVVGSDASFATYGANGFSSAPFTSADLTTSLATDIADGGDIPVTLAAGASVHALRLGFGSIAGAPVTVRSGGLITNGTATHTADFAFNNGSANVEAVVYASPATTTTLSGAVSAAGLTKFGNGTLYLTNTALATSLAGTIAVQAGVLSVGADNVTDNPAFFPQFANVEVNDGATLNLFQSAALGNISGTGTIRLGNTNTTRRTLGIAPTVNGVFSGTLSNNNDGVASATGSNGGVSVTLQKGGAGNLELKDARVVGIREIHVLNRELIFSGTTTFTEQTTRGRLEIHQGATFTLDNREVNNFDRLGLEYQTTTEPGGYFRLSGGTFNFLGNAAEFSSEVIGRFNGAAPQAPTWGPGNDVINLVAGGGTAPAAIAFVTDNPGTAQSFLFVREQGASVLFRGTGLGTGSVGTAGVTNVLLSSRPTMTGGSGANGTASISIMPGVIASSVIGGIDNYGLATHDFGPDGLFNSGDDRGVRRLSGAEMTPAIAEGVVGTDNVQLTSASQIATTASINSLHIAGGGSLGGSGTVTVTSGTVLASGGANGGIGVASPGVLDFAAVEAVFFTGSDLSVGSVVAGGNGLTAGGPAKLSLLNVGNTFSGPVTINGRLAVAGDGALGNAANPVNINMGGTLELGGSFTMARSVRIGTPDLRANVPQVASYDARFHVEAGQSVSITGGISGGLGAITGGVSLSTGLRPSEVDALVKQGAGTLVLTSAETYTGGTRVEAGTLAVMGSLSPNSPVLVQGGTLAGSGNVLGSALVKSGATVSPGLLGNGVLGIAQNLFVEAGATMAFELSNTGGIPLAGFDYDQLNVGTGGDFNSTASVTLGGATLALTLGSGITMGDRFFLLLNDGLDPITGTFAGLPQDAIVTAGAQEFRISYVADSASDSMAGGNDVALLVVPEPSGLCLLLGGLGLMAGRRRRS